jgi:hypothetical protein
MEFGIAAPGVYYALLEYIGMDDENGGYLPEAYSIKYLSKKFKLEADELKAIIQYMVDLDLFDKNEWEKSGKVYCPKLINMADNYTQQRNREALKKKKEPSKSIKQPTKNVKVSTSQKRREEKRVEENKEEKNKSAEKSTPSIRRQFSDLFSVMFEANYGTKFKEWEKSGASLTKLIEFTKGDIKKFEAMLKVAFDPKYWINKNGGAITLNKVCAQRTELDVLSLDSGNGTVKELKSGERILNI